MAREYEQLHPNGLETAEQYMLKWIARYEGDPEKMGEMGRFYLRIGKPEKADEYLRDAFSFQIKNQKIALEYACQLLQLSRCKEAIVIFNKLL